VSFSLEKKVLFLRSFVGVFFFPAAAPTAGLSAAE